MSMQIFLNASYYGRPARLKYHRKETITKLQISVSVLLVVFTRQRETKLLLSTTAIYQVPFWCSIICGTSDIPLT